MDWDDDGCDGRHLSIGVKHEPMHILDKASPAEDSSTVAAPACSPQHGWGSWLQLAPPGGSSSTYEEDVDAFLTPGAVSPRSMPDFSTAVGRLSLDDSPPDHDHQFGADYGPSVTKHAVFSTESSPGTQMHLQGAERGISDFDRFLAEYEEERAESAVEPKGYTPPLNEAGAFPEVSSESSSTNRDSSSGGTESEAEVDDEPPQQQPTLQSALEELSQPVTEAIPPDGHLEVSLMKHQRIALSWMLQKEATCSGGCAGGILADDQGLGKTLSTIALIVTERPQRPGFKIYEEDDVDMVGSDEGDVDRLGRSLSLGGKRRRTSSVANPSTLALSPPSGSRPAGGTLVVCPTSVLRQWADEFQKKVSSKANLSFLEYHGPNRTRDPKELARYDVVLTTYHIVALEIPKEVLGVGDDKVNDDEDWLRSYPDMAPSPDARSAASRKRKKKPRGAADAKSSQDTQALVGPIAMVSWFRVVLDEAQTIKNHKTLSARACSRLAAKRRWCLSGTPIQNSINDLYSYFRFLRHETYSLYSDFRFDIKIPIERSPTLGYQKLKPVLKEILLRRTKETRINGQPIVDIPPKSVEIEALDFSEEERAFYNDLESESRKQFREYEYAGTVKQNYVNILQMLLRLRQACNHPALIPTGSEPLSSASTTGITAKNAKLPGKDKCLDLLNRLVISQTICAVCSDLPENEVVSVCGHVFCNQCISEHLSGDDGEEKTCPEPSCKEKLSAATVFTKASLQCCISDVQLEPDTPFEGVIPVLNGSDKKADVFRADSSKIKAAMQMLMSLPMLENSSSCDKGRITAGQSTEKVLVFSQWTKMLDLLENKLRNSPIQYRRLDGTMSVGDREKAMTEFKSQPGITIMLLSLKAASIGLNMVAANHVLLLDPWWNPTTEDQAIDRAHRIGQTRPVKVTRLTVKDTVEDRIMKLQEKKRGMVASVFEEVGKGSGQSKLTEQDLADLFKA